MFEEMFSCYEENVLSLVELVEYFDLVDIESMENCLLLLKVIEILLKSV